MKKYTIEKPYEIANRKNKKFGSLKNMCLASFVSLIALFCILK